MNGSISVSTLGGTGSLTYLWNTGANSASLNNIAAGAYTLTITDANACVSTQTYAVPGLGGPTVSVLSTGNASCFGVSDGTASVLASSGNAPYTYNWIPSGGNQPTADSLAAGNYSVNVTDVNGCLTSVNINITEPTAVVANAPNAPKRPAPLFGIPGMFLPLIFFTPSHAPLANPLAVCPIVT